MNIWRYFFIKSDLKLKRSNPDKRLSCLKHIIYSYFYHLNVSTSLEKVCWVSEIYGSHTILQVVGFWCWWSRILSNVDVVSDSCYWSELCHPSQDGTMEHVSATATTNTQPIETVWLQSWPQYSTPLCLQWEGIGENQSRSGDIFLTRFPSLSTSSDGTKRGVERFNFCLSMLNAHSALPQFCGIQQVETC